MAKVTKHRFQPIPKSASPRVVPGKAPEQPPGASRHIVDALLLVKVAEGTVHQCIVTPEQMNMVFELLRTTGGVSIVMDPVPFAWTRPDSEKPDDQKPGL